MSKKFVATVVAGLCAIGIGAVAEAQSVTPVSQPVQPGQSFQVTYAPCFPENRIVFTFEGQTASVECGGFEDPSDPPIDDSVGDLEAGSASATFNAPATPGTYTGTAQPEVSRPQGLRSPVARSSGFADLRVEQGACDPQFGCATFTVVVPEPTTTSSSSTTSTSTTVAATTSTTATTVAATTTLAPTTTLAGSGPVTPTTTMAAAAPSLPATGPSRSDNTATIAIALLAAGGAFVIASRWRPRGTSH